LLSRVCGNCTIFAMEAPLARAVLVEDLDTSEFVNADEIAPKVLAYGEDGRLDVYSESATSFLTPETD